MRASVASLEVLWLLKIQRRCRSFPSKKLEARLQSAGAQLADENRLLWALGWGNREEQLSHLVSTALLFNLITSPLSTAQLLHSRVAVLHYLKTTPALQELVNKAHSRCLSSLKPLAPSTTPPSRSLHVWFFPYRETKVQQNS